MGSGFNCYDMTFITYEQEIHHNVNDKFFLQYKDFTAIGNMAALNVYWLCV